MKRCKGAYRAKLVSCGLGGAAIYLVLTTGCGTGEYNSRFEKTLQTAAAPPAAEPPPAEAPAEAAQPASP